MLQHNKNAKNNSGIVVQNDLQYLNENIEYCLMVVSNSYQAKWKQHENPYSI